MRIYIHGGDKKKMSMHGQRRLEKEAYLIL
jgi:hypothetical protein